MLDTSALKPQSQPQPQPQQIANNQLNIQSTGLLQQQQQQQQQHSFFDQQQQQSLQGQAQLQNLQQLQQQQQQQQSQQLLLQKQQQQQQQQQMQNIRNSSLPNANVGNRDNNNNNNNNNRDGKDVAAVYQIAYGKPGPMGVSLMAHALSYQVAPGQSQGIHVAIVREGPPGSPIRPGDVLLSVNGQPMVAVPDQSPGGNEHAQMVSLKLSQEPPPRVMRFFRCGKINVAEAIAAPFIIPTELSEVEADVLLQG